MLKDIIVIKPTEMNKIQYKIDGTILKIGTAKLKVMLPDNYVEIIHLSWDEQNEAYFDYNFHGLQHRFYLSDKDLMAQILEDQDEYGL
jgi:hypothetical protein